MTQTLEWTDQDWLSPPSAFRGAPFWSWNSRMAPDRLRRQIESMHDAGMGGFFMHSRYGLKTPYLSDEWFDCIGACVDKARELEMKAYLYDEDRWPSGAAGGLVTRAHPEFGAHMLVALRGDHVGEPLERLGGFAVRLDDSGRLIESRALTDGGRVEPGEVLVNFAVGARPPSPWFNEAPYLDVLNADAVAEFIRVTYQAYADRCGEDFGGVIPAIFTDEPNYAHGRASVAGAFASAPWTLGLARAFKKRRGYDVRDRLPEIVFPPAAGDGPSFNKVRHDFWLTLTELFVEGFSAQIGKWCANHTIAMTGHYLGEETLGRQIGVVGSAMPHYAHQQWPGIDILCDREMELSTAKQCTSVAAQFGRERVLSETYGCTGWDWPLEGHKFNAGWQYVLGVNLRCPHLTLYSLAGGAKRDYPASIRSHSPWWKYYRVVEDHFARLGLLLTRGKPVRDVLLLTPIESAYGLYQPDAPDRLDGLERPFQTLIRALLDAHLDYDLGDESILAAHAKVEQDRLKVGRMNYALAIVPPCITLRRTTVALLRRFRAAGGAVLFVGAPPGLVDGGADEAEAAADLAALIDGAARCGADAVADAAEGLLDRRLSITEGGRQADAVWAMLRRVKGGRVLFCQSMDRGAGHTVAVSVQGRRPVVLMDTATGARRRVEAEKVGDRVAFELELPPTGTALLTLGLRTGDADKPARPLRVRSSAEAPPPWPIERVEPNTFPLDYCRVRVGDGETSDPVPVLAAETMIREGFGLPRRVNGGCQPWYLAATGRADREKRGRCELHFGFHVTDVPGELRLAIERPGDYEIVLNGRAVSSEPVGWWVDEDIATVDLSSAVAAGDNALVLTFDYSSDMEIEDLHLVGEFGIRQTGERRELGAYTLVAPPAELGAGSWVGQGLDFYGGAVNYRVKLPPGVRDDLAAGRRVRVSLPDVRCTCAAVHVGDETTVLAWAPMSADVTEALRARPDCDEVVVEVIGGRKNILGPLHVPWLPWTGPNEFDPGHEQWTDEYLLNDHGLMAPPVVEIVE